jgi:hypothetical protein
MLFFRSKYLLLWLCKCSFSEKRYRFGAKKKAIREFLSANSNASYLVGKIRTFFAVSRCVSHLSVRRVSGRKSSSGQRRLCVSVVENIYHSKMFFRSIWKAKRVPETWWGFSIFGSDLNGKARVDFDREWVWMVNKREEKEEKHSKCEAKGESKNNTKKNWILYI